MEQDHRARRTGAAAILCALLWRLFAPGVPERIAEFLTQPNIASFLIYLETGRDVRFSPSLEVFYPRFVESPAPAIPAPPEVSLPTFSGAEEIELYYGCTADPDTDALIRQPLAWDLQGQEPTVLILHTHSTESYTQDGEPYAESSRWRTLDDGYNMLSIGQLVQEGLGEAGIIAVQDRNLYDHPSYNGSYVRARKAIAQWLEAYPGIQLILDLHRDASGGDTQMRTHATIDGQPAAQLMLVLGTNHENYQENLSIALKLHAQLEGQCPGIMRPLQLRSQRFNQDLSPGGLLIEVGAAGNTHGEARLSAEQLVKAIVALAKGAGPGDAP